jgi:hypothetical protein
MMQEKITNAALEVGGGGGGSACHARDGEGRAALEVCRIEIAAPTPQSERWKPGRRR